MPSRSASPAHQQGASSRWSAGSFSAPATLDGAARIMSRPPRHRAGLSPLRWPWSVASAKAFPIRSCSVTADTACASDRGVGTRRTSCRPMSCTIIGPSSAMAWRATPARHCSRYSSVENSFTFFAAKNCQTSAKVFPRRCAAISAVRAAFFSCAGAIPARIASCAAAAFARAPAKPISRRLAPRRALCSHGQVGLPVAAAPRLRGRCARGISPAGGWHGRGRRA